MNIEVGMYVRTPFGIKRIAQIDNNKTVWKYLYKLNDDHEFGALSDKDIIDEPSFDIKDLIKVGDIIEWEKTEPFFDGGVNQVIDYFGHIGVFPIDNEYAEKLESITIQAVLTTEQFNKHSFKVEQ